MSAEYPAEYSTKELSKWTWPDFEKLFLKQGVVGDGWWCWCMHHHVSSYSLTENQQPRTRAERAVRNPRQKAELVENGCAHGILVYAKGETVGWCQYGPREQLPRVDNTQNYRRVDLEGGTQRFWRITCVVVAKQHPRGGVATV